MNIKELKEVAELSYKRDVHIVTIDRLLKNELRCIEINSTFNDKITEKKVLNFVSTSLVNYYKEKLKNIDEILFEKYGITQ